METTNTAASRRPRVLLVANYRPGTGFAWWLMENFWVQFTEVARERGWDVLLSYPTDGPIPEVIRSAGIPTITLPFPGRTLRDLWRAVGLVRAQNIRCVYFTDRRFSRLAYAFLRLAGVRIIINHDHTPGDRPPVGGVKGAVKWLLRRLPMIGCDLQICVSPLIRERAIVNVKVPPDRITVVQNGIEPIQCSGDPTYLHQMFGLPESAAVCISAGRAHHYKRIDFMIEVARLCVDEYGLDDLFFVFCGDGPDMERLIKLKNAAGLEDRFIFGGYRKDLESMLCSANLAIHPSRGEAFSLAILEYMSASLPVVVPGLPSVSQAVEDEVTGFVYEDGSADDAARAVRRLARDRSLRERLGRAGEEVVRKSYSLDSMNERFRSVVEASLENVE